MVHNKHQTSKASAKSLRNIVTAADCGKLREFAKTLLFLFSRRALSLRSGGAPARNYFIHVGTVNLWYLSAKTLEHLYRAIPTYTYYYFRTTTPKYLLFAYIRIEECKLDNAVVVIKQTSQLLRLSGIIKCSVSISSEGKQSGITSR